MSIILVCSLTLAKSTSSRDGNLGMSIAKPILRVVVDENIHISNYYLKPLNFFVCNYDENNNASDVAMQYYITIEASQVEAPLLYKLYRIYADKEEEIELSSNKGISKSVEPIRINSNKRIEHYYKLEIQYDFNSKNKLDENIEILLSANSEQINPSM